jgi:hypothetical protein
MPRDSSMSFRFFSRLVKRNGSSLSLSKTISTVSVKAPYSALVVT